MHFVPHHNRGGGPGPKAWLGSSCALVLLFALASCGWHSGGLTPASAPSARTVGVEVFWTHEKVLERDLEPDLQRELSRAASDLSGLALARVSEADVIVRGKIKEYRRRSGIRSPENQLLESGVRILVEAELVDRLTGEVLASAPARVWSGYALIGPDQERAARDRALRQIAETLTLSLFQAAPAPPGGTSRDVHDGAQDSPDADSDPESTTTRSPGAH